jgi:hypothetical protein
MSITDFDPERALKFADDFRHRAGQLQQEVNETEIDVSSQDRSIKVTVTVAGKIRSLALDRSVIEDRESVEVAANLLALLQKAQEISEKAGNDLARQYLPRVPDFGALFSRPYSHGRGDMR